jgi:hypothetical protein
MLSKGWINEFCLEQSLLFRKKGESKRIVLENLNTDIIYKDFIDFTNNKEKVDFSLGKIELLYLKNLLKATIVRNVFDDKKYYQVLSKEDEFIKNALEFFNNN